MRNRPIFTRLPGHALGWCSALLVVFVLLIGYAERGLFAPAAAAPLREGSGVTYYVATNGNNTNPGTEAKPLGSIQNAVNRAKPGDTIYVRGGVYHETVKIAASGTEQQPITIAAYPGERPVIDGQYTLPTGDPVRWNRTIDPPRYFVADTLVRIRGNYIRFRGFEIIRSLGSGIIVSNTSSSRNHHVTIEDCSVHDIRNTPIRMLYADYVTVERCDVYHGSDYATHDRPTSELNWPNVLIAVDSTHITFRKNVVHENWGEGIGAGADSTDVVIEDNVIYNNMGVQLYVHRARNVLVQRNLLYHTNDPAFHRGRNPSGCIALNNEDNFPDSITVKNVTIRNNVMVGCQKNIAIWGSNGENLPVEDVLIAHNTLVNATANTGPQDAVNINFVVAVLRNIRVEKNIIYQKDQFIGQAPNDPQISYSNNLWSRTPPAHMRSPSDLITDPQLANPNAPLVPGGVQLAWYSPLPSSPARPGNLGAYELYDSPLATGTPPSATPTRTPTPTLIPTTPTTPAPTPTPTGPTPTPTPTRVLTACPSDQISVLNNPSFEAGVMGWQFTTNGRGALTPSTAAFECQAAAQMEISRPGSNVQLYQRAVQLEPNTRYRLTFAAYSNSGHDLAVYLHKHSGSQTNYGIKNAVANLTTNWKLFGIEFTSTGFTNPVDNGRLRFWLSPYDAAGDIYRIDRIQLTKADAISMTNGDAVEWITNTVELTPTNAVVWGYVQLPDAAPANGVQVLLSDAETNGENFQDVVETDGEGRFQFVDMPAGNYLLSVISPAGYIAPAPMAVRVRRDDDLDFTVVLEQEQGGGATNTIYLPLIDR